MDSDNAGGGVPAINVFDIVLSKLAESESSASIDMAISEAEQLIKNYCSLNYVPGELVFVWANMALDILAADASLSEGGMPQVGDVLTSISLGDTSYGFTNVRKNCLNEIRDNYAVQLGRFRKGLFGDE
ncbi:MAG: hypothetical protein ACOX7H_04545 [Bacillota bacterium]